MYILGGKVADEPIPKPAPAAAAPPASFSRLDGKTAGSSVPCSLLWMRAMAIQNSPLSIFPSLFTSAKFL